MNIHRRISRLNGFFLTELGGSEPYSWQYTNSLLHPAIEVEPSDSAPGGLREVYETVCTCGIGYNIHKPSCRMSVARKKTRMVPIMPLFPDAWVVCRKLYADEEAWKRSFGTAMHFPREGYWFPFTVQVGTLDPIFLKTKRSQLPTDEQTVAAIAAIREHRRTHPADIKDEQERAAAREKSQEHENRVLAIKECSIGATRNLLPGRRINASYASPQSKILIPEGVHVH